jgi:hypothetical protein
LNEGVAEPDLEFEGGGGLVKLPSYPKVGLSIGNGGVFWTVMNPLGGVPTLLASFSFGDS